MLLHYTLIKNHELLIDPSSHNMIFTLLVFYSYSEYLDKCHLPLGLEHGIIKDEFITSSSFYTNDLSNTTHEAHFARLRNDSYWRPATDDVTPWIQVSFTHRMVISGLVIQGSGEDGGWVTELKVTYSLDGQEWNTYGNLLDDSERPEVCSLKYILFDTHDMFKTIFELILNT